MRFRTFARSVVEVFAQAALAACAASSASSTSSAVERGISQNGRPVTGVMFSKYWPFAGATHWPLMKLP